MLIATASTTRSNSKYRNAKSPIQCPTVVQTINRVDKRRLYLLIKIESMRESTLSTQDVR